MLIGQMKLTHYFHTKKGKLYVPSATWDEAHAAYIEAFGVDYETKDDKIFLMHVTVLPEWDFNWCMAE